MTVLMTFVGTIVFIVSLFTASFKQAVWRLLVFIGIGMFIDMFIISIAVCVNRVV